MLRLKYNSNKNKRLTIHANKRSLLISRMKQGRNNNAWAFKLYWFPLIISTFKIKDNSDCYSKWLRGSHRIMKSAHSDYDSPRAWSFRAGVNISDNGAKVQRAKCGNNAPVALGLLSRASVSSVNWKLPPRGLTIAAARTTGICSVNSCI